MTCRRNDPAVFFDLRSAFLILEIFAAADAIPVFLTAALFTGRRSRIKPDHHVYMAVADDLLVMMRHAVKLIANPYRCLIQTLVLVLDFCDYGFDGLCMARIILAYIIRGRLILFTVFCPGETNELPGMPSRRDDPAAFRCLSSACLI